jgi:hypothetical protein
MVLVTELVGVRSGVTGQWPERTRRTSVDVSLHESWLPKEHPLYRPRHGRQLLAKVCALVFFVVPLLGLLVFGAPPGIGNRPRQGFPGLSQGWGFFTGLSGWATDNLSFRQGAVNLAGGISRGVFGEPAPFGQAGDNTGPLVGSSPSTAPTANAGQGQTSGGYPQVIQGTDGWLYLGFDIQGKCEPAQPLDAVLANLVRLKAAVEASGRQFVLFVAPDKSTVVPEHLPATYVGKSCAAAVSSAFWQRIVSQVGADDPRAELRAAEKTTRQPVYFQQDTHWNFTGGLIMTRELADQIQPDASTTWQVSRGTRFAGPADLPPMIAQSGTDTAYRYQLAPDGRGDRTRSINSDFLTPVTFHTAAPVTGMVTARTAMIGDSFAQYAAPFLAATFADITITNPETVGTDPAAEAAQMVNSKVVVVEVVERNLVAGVSPVTSASVVDTIATALAAHPLR